MFTGKRAQETATSESFFCSVLELFGREGGEVQRGGGGRWSKVGVPHKGNHWQRSCFTLCSSEPSLPLSVCIRLESACTCVSGLTGLSHSNWLFINAVMLAARAAVSRREAELDLVDSK